LGLAITLTNVNIYPPPPLTSTSTSTSTSTQQDTGKVLNGEPMKRMTILLKDFAYAITLDEAFLYVVKTDP
jgi:hypothetical protein